MTDDASAAPATETSASPSSFRDAMAEMADMPAPEMGEGGKVELPGYRGMQRAKQGRGNASDDYVAQREAAQRASSPGDEMDEAPEPELEEGEPEYDENTGEPDIEEQPQEEAQEEQPTDEQQQAGEPTPEDLRGVWEALSGPTLPDELLDRQVLIKDGDREYYESIAELRNGRMRHDHYSRKSQELSDKMKDVQTSMEGLRGQFDAMRQNPRTGLMYLRNMLGDEAVDKMVDMRAIQRYQIEKAPPELRPTLIEHDRMLIMQMKLEADQRRLQQQAQVPMQHQAIQKANDTLEQILPQLYERHGIVRTRNADQMLSAHMGVFWSDRNPQTFHAALEEAAKATRMELAAYAEGHVQEWQQQRPRRPMPKGQPVPQHPAAAAVQRRQLSPRGMPGPTPKAGQRRRGTINGGGSPSDFGKLFRGVNGR